jgi:hypothetical protein
VIAPEGSRTVDRFAMDRMKAFRRNSRTQIENASFPPAVNNSREDLHLPIVFFWKSRCETNNLGFGNLCATPVAQFQREPLVVFAVDLWAVVCILLQPDDFHRLARLPTSRGWCGCKNSRPDIYLGTVGTHKDFFSHPAALGTGYFRSEVFRCDY